MTVTAALIVVLTIALAATGTALVCGWRAHRDTVSAQAVRDVLDGVDHSEHGAPCRHVGCMIARTELWRLINGTRAAKRHARHHPAP